MDLLLAFPLLLFAIALVAVLGDWKFLFFSADNTRVGLLVVIIGFFNWPYIGRIIRGQTLSLREKEYVEAARSLGAGNARILFRELLPNLVGPILVYSTLIIPTNILFEAALSFLGVGVRIPNPSWGGMLSDAVQYYGIDPMYMIVPGVALFITVMAFNLFGDGLRDALDPRSNR
jgi:ABC-type dipeptide/oligopeptide/nickel transport system permease subunit